MGRIGRQPIHGEPKVAYTVRTTEEAWDGLKQHGIEAGLSLSEYLEALGKTGVMLK
ncbi:MULTISPECIES: hypothetical protein [Moorena]|uniref:hypothetical protein n=1 Tax=Moorena TaxID=1155738 RepID=UPI00143BBE3C|nr:MULTISPECIES: hypothetical protein [Moorena]